jgi:glycogenin glucosyltransferase
MATRYAFVTLLTSDSYLPGALTLAAALRDIHPKPAVEPEVDFETACIVTPETVDVSSIKLLRGAFDVVIGVEIIEEGDKKGLDLLGKSRCPVSEAKAIGARRSSGLADYEVDLYGLPMG